MLIDIDIKAAGGKNKSGSSTWRWEKARWLLAVGGQGNPFHSLQHTRDVTLLHQGTHQACYAMREYIGFSSSSSMSVRVVMKELLLWIYVSKTIPVRKCLLRGVVIQPGSPREPRTQHSQIPASVGETQAHRKKGLIPISLTACFLSSEVCALMCKALCTPSVTVRQHWKVRKKSFDCITEHLPAGWC